MSGAVAGTLAGLLLVSRLGPGFSLPVVLQEGGGLRLSAHPLRQHPASGSGKSTLPHLVGGLDHSTDGEV
ncbi:MAG: hypothetical protein QN152_11395 [Armatimonadota bacterium]|nr:hypothetical protein [Armatimonadota bacterium]MDR7426556.1 hypothetical protein [Armatimonadota bacterium]MDR7464239.1 hypothetical protein [Armatimonadota bacterium]MDR7470834.1 hypothetical protein [Armatimonadota bacterium]MDR7474534.1 hypothetical protein [Armatimonadota bacterium]